ncbi:MAG: DUF402 domain-containing protein [Mycoplasmoidaceae bacterium]
MKIGKKVMIHAYKKNGWLYRTWEFPKILEINDRYVCVSMKNSSVITSEKYSDRNFLSKNIKQAYWLFLADEWFNVVATVSNGKISYYINLASPFIYEEEAIKYIDFDVDLKIDHKGNVKVLDLKEFNEHRIEFNYGNKLSKIIELELEKIKSKDFINLLRQKINIEFLNELSKRIEDE